MRSSVQCAYDVVASTLGMALEGQLMGHGEIVLEMLRLMTERFGEAFYDTVRENADQLGLQVSVLCYAVLCCDVTSVYLWVRLL